MELFFQQDESGPSEERTPHKLASIRNSRLPVGLRYSFPRAMRSTQPEPVSGPGPGSYYMRDHGYERTVAFPRSERQRNFGKSEDIPGPGTYNPLQKWKGPAFTMAPTRGCTWYDDSEEDRFERWW